jgi:hypothetical protein
MECATQNNWRDSVPGEDSNLRSKSLFMKHSFSSRQLSYPESYPPRFWSTRKPTARLLAGPPTRILTVAAGTLVLIGAVAISFVVFVIERKACGTG